MKKIINRLYLAWRSYKLRKQAKNKLQEKLFNSPLQYVRAIREIDCLIDGHKWTSSFDPKTEISKKLKDRVYCKKCGVYYHEHTYKEEISKVC